MRTYSATGSRALSTTSGSDTILQIYQPATPKSRIGIKYVELHSAATSDDAYTVNLMRMTAAGSGGSTFTPTLLDPADPAASAVVRLNDTTSPTITASSEVLTLGGHMRSTVMWYAPDGGQIIIPATASAGIVTQTAAVATGFTQSQNIQWEE